MKNRYIYFVSECHSHKLRGSSAVKIGVARDPKKRLAVLQTGNPKKLELAITLGPMTEKQAFNLERTLHICFKDHHVHGEWFKKNVFHNLKALNDLRIPGDVTAYKIISGETTRYARENALVILEEQEAARRMEMETVAAAKKIGL